MRVIMIPICRQMLLTKTLSRLLQDLRVLGDIQLMKRKQCITPVSHHLVQLPVPFHRRHHRINLHDPVVSQQIRHVHLHLQTNRPNPLASHQICHVYLRLHHHQRSSHILVATMIMIPTITLHLTESRLLGPLEAWPLPTLQRQSSKIPTSFTPPRLRGAANSPAHLKMNHTHRLPHSLHSLFLPALLDSLWRSKGRARTLGDPWMSLGPRANMASSPATQT